MSKTVRIKTLNFVPLHPQIEEKEDGTPVTQQFTTHSSYV
jgi:hypothetical protein